MHPQPIVVGFFFKHKLNLFCMVEVEWKEIYLYDFIKCVFNIVLDADKLICFKLGMMLDLLNSTV